MSIISIARMGGGLNNQKMMLLALLVIALETDSEIKLPPLINYVTNKKSNIFKKYFYGKIIYPLFDRYVPFFNVFDQELFLHFLKKYNINISSKQSDISHNNTDMFNRGSAIIEEFVNGDDFPHRQFVTDFFKYLQPSAYMKEKIDFFINQALPFDAVCQLRIEDDWPLNVDEDWSEKEGKHNLPSPIVRSIVIFEKIHNTLPDLENIYVTYDKNGLTIPFSTISDAIKEKFGYTIKSKRPSSTKKTNPINALEASIIDFEMSVQADVYIGTEMSSFTLLSNITKECRESMHCPHRYLYNAKGSQLSIYTSKNAY